VKDKSANHKPSSNTNCKCGVDRPDSQLDFEICNFLVNLANRTRRLQRNYNSRELQPSLHVRLAHLVSTFHPTTTSKIKGFQDYTDNDNKTESTINELITQHKVNFAR
jgi:hypothetical protein